MTDAHPKGKGYLLYASQHSADISHLGPDPEAATDVKLGEQAEMEADALADLCFWLRHRHGEQAKILLVVGVD